MSSYKKEGDRGSSPFVSAWSGKKKLTSEEFLRAFNKYDRDSKYTFLQDFPKFQISSADSFL